jgi:predicted translin family RNA/ssDNA-binding protein
MTDAERARRYREHQKALRDEALELSRNVTRVTEEVAALAIR